MKIRILLTLFLTSYATFSQVSIGSSLPNPSANLDVNALDVQGNKRGLLIPRVSLLNTTDSSTITNGNVNSLLVFNEATQGDVTPGFYYWYIDKWERIKNGSGASVETNTDLYFDEITGDLIYTNELDNNPVLNLNSLKIEPWQVEGTNEKATLNNQNIYQIGNVGIGTNDIIDGVALDVRGAVRGGTGNTGTVGLNSATFGSNNAVSGSNSAATGINNNVSGSVSGAIGQSNIVNANDAMAIGIGNVINADKSFTVGQGNVVTGNLSSAMGKENIADGEVAVAYGVNNQSIADYSYTLGVGNIAGAMGSMVLGRYNARIDGDPNNFAIPTDPYFQIGSGDGPTNRRNIMTILKNGKTGFGTIYDPQATIHIVKTATDLTPAIIEGCEVFNDNAAATAAGVPVGGLYRTPTGVLMVRF